ncbi:hypothetical protein MANES_08G032450v8 [Manihot esculenta]|uniref:Uncharacterized protein n=1 Tax=Manihot esculenta TaxID=3983 RepID=A0ACB7H897_MANES|nr:hypothetical protein MANES_08G032450v8 [Manihot esculenta]
MGSVHRKNGDFFLRRSSFCLFKIIPSLLQIEKIMGQCFSFDTYLMIVLLSSMEIG